jgi:hypothetical protein
MKEKREKTTEKIRISTETIIEKTVPEGTCPEILEWELEQSAKEGNFANIPEQILVEKEEVKEETGAAENKNSLAEICNKIRKFWRDNYLIKDIDMIDIPLAVGLSHGLPDDPVWLIMIAQSSGLKSEIIRSFGDVPTQFVLPISKITPNAIMSGSKGEECLAYEANNKILMIKDLTTILESKPETVAAVASGLREMYDGYISVASGLSGGNKHTKVDTTVIAGVTPDAIDNTRIFKTEMGERVLYKRFPKFEVEATEKMKETLINQSLTSGINRNEIRGLMNDFMKQVFMVRKDNKKYENMKITDKESFGKIVDLATLVAQLRRGVKWSYNGRDIEDIGTPEAPYRLAKQLFKLTICVKNVKGNENIDNDVLRSIVRVGMDCIPRKRYVALMPILKMYSEGVKGPGIERSNIRYYGKNLMGVGPYSINHSLDELEEFNIVESETSENNKWYKFTKSFMNNYAAILNVLSDVYKDQEEFNTVDIIFKIHEEPGDSIVDK